jgi:hypothetical protein
MGPGKKEKEGYRREITAMSGVLLSNVYVA